MKFFLIAFISLVLVGCANPLTRLLPKIDKIDPPAELMLPPKELKNINKPTPQEIVKILEERENRKKKAELEAFEAAENVPPN